MQIIGHRGASGYKPENTLASFQAAISLGVDIIELDVFALRTGEVVVMHDETVDRTTDGTGHVSEFSLEQLRMLDAGDGQKVPLLSEVLDLINKRIPVNIELKGRNVARPVAHLIRRYVNTKGWRDRHFLVSSFDHKELRDFANFRPTVRVGALFEDRPANFMVMEDDDFVYSLNMEAPFITGPIVSDAHAKGLKVFAYTVNTTREAKRLRALKVDGIFTDYPDRILEVTGKPYEAPIFTPRSLLQADFRARRSTAVSAISR